MNLRKLAQTIASRICLTADAGRHQSYSAVIEPALIEAYEAGREQMRADAIYMAVWQIPVQVPLSEFGVFVALEPNPFTTRQRNHREIAAAIGALEPKSGAWYVRDYGDGWIPFENEKNARASEEAKNGNMIKGPISYDRVRCVRLIEEYRSRTRSNMKDADIRTSIVFTCTNLIDDLIRHS